MFITRQRVEKAHADGVWSVSWRGDKIITGAIDGTCKLWYIPQLISLISFIKSSRDLGASIHPIALMTSSTITKRTYRNIDKDTDNVLAIRQDKNPTTESSSYGITSVAISRFIVFNHSQPSMKPTYTKPNMP